MNFVFPTFQMSKRKNRVLDSYISVQFKDGEIYKDYDVTLNQTDIKTNKNKYYIMQIVKKNSQYMVFVRYGRIGERGRASENCYSDPKSAEGWFEKQFYSKTKNRWDKRTDFKAFKGKYHLLDTNYDDVPELDESQNPKKKTKKVDSMLHKRVQQFIGLISDLDTMKNTMVDLDIDTKKLPLGKISQEQIERGYTILTKIKNALKTGGSDVVDLSSEFYTIIPYACGRSVPPVIKTDKLIEKFTQTLDELKNIQVAVKVVESSNNLDQDIHQMDKIYNSCQTEIKPLSKTSEMWNIIRDYVHNTHASTHSNYTVELQDVFEIQRHGSRDNYLNKFGKLDNRMLLWHGTRLTNYISILQKGLLLRPDVIPGVYITGKMFGNGVYFANSFSKSFNYTGASKRNNVACLFLSEVALGNPSKRLRHDYYITKEKLAQEGCHSTWGQGKSTPQTPHKVLSDGVVIPNGKLSKSDVSGSLLYDEFIVYDQNQFNLRYIVQVKGNFKY